MFKCYYCGHNAGEVLATRDGMRFRCFGENKRILRCTNCNLIQLFPQWSDTTLEKLYTNYSEKKDFKGQKRKVKISKYLIKFIKKGDWIIEVGCGQGDNVKYLQSKGFNVFGIDKDPGAAGIQVDVRDYNPIVKLDVVYAIHLLEHLADPALFISWAIDNLEKGGRFIFEIPCVEDPLLKLYKLNAFSNFYWYPYHLFFFSKQTAENLFKGEAKVIRRQEYGIINHLRWLVFRRPGNWNPHIPILDDIYKFILKRCGYSDTLVVVGNV